MPAISVLTEKVAENKDAKGSVIQLLGNLVTILIKSKNDPAAVQALADQLKNNGDKIATAVVANTPAV